MFLRQILSCYNLKTSFAKLVKVLALELFCGMRTLVHFSISVLVLEVFCGSRACTRTWKLSTRLHHWWLSKSTAPIQYLTATGVNLSLAINSNTK